MTSASPTGLARRDAAMLSWIQSGDPDALQAFFREFHQQIYRWCRIALRDPQDAEEATSRVFLAVTRTRLRGVAQLVPYVRKTALNSCNTVARERSRSAADELADDLPAQRRDEDEDLTRAELRQVVWRAMAGLEPRDRFLFEAEWRDRLDNHRDTPGRDADHADHKQQSDASGGNKTNDGHRHEEPKHQSDASHGNSAPDGNSSGGNRDWQGNDQETGRQNLDYKERSDASGGHNNDSATGRNRSDRDDVVDPPRMGSKRSGPPYLPPGPPIGPPSGSSGWPPAPPYSPPGSPAGPPGPPSGSAGWPPGPPYPPPGPPGGPFAPPHNQSQTGGNRIGRPPSGSSGSPPGSPSGTSGGAGGGGSGKNAQFAWGGDDAKRSKPAVVPAVPVPPTVVPPPLVVPLPPVVPPPLVLPVPRDGVHVVTPPPAGHDGRTGQHEDVRHGDMTGRLGQGQRGAGRGTAARRPAVDRDSRRRKRARVTLTVVAVLVLILGAAWLPWHNKSTDPQPIELTTDTDSSSHTTDGGRESVTRPGSAGEAASRPDGGAVPRAGQGAADLRHPELGDVTSGSNGDAALAPPQVPEPGEAAAPPSSESDGLVPPGSDTDVAPPPAEQVPPAGSGSGAESSQSEPGQVDTPTSGETTDPPLVSGEAGVQPDQGLEPQPDPGVETQPDPVVEEPPPSQPDAGTVDPPPPPPEPQCGAGQFLYEGQCYDKPV